MVKIQLQDFILIFAMQLRDEISCNICFRLPKQALQCTHQRCGKLICKECYNVVIQQFRKENRQDKCPFCTIAPFIVKDSHKYQGLINKQPIKCRHCKTDYIFSEIERHEAQCNLKMIKCQFCNKSIFRKDIVQHTQTVHKDKISLILQTCFTVKPPIYDLQKIPQLRDVKLPNLPQLGTTGKFYCNGLLGSPMCNCCGTRCGPFSGQNCVNCMRLDMVRRGLTRGYLVNSNGEVSWIDDQDKFTCGTLYSSNNLRCGQGGGYCKECTHLQRSHKRYSILLPI